MNSLFDDVPAIPDSTDFLNYEPFKRKYGTPDKIASEILDESKDYSLEMYYADMAEEIQGKVLDLVGSEIEKVMATEKGQRMF